MKILKSYNVQVWVGLKETNGSGVYHTISEVCDICQKYVNDIKDCVTITETKFVYVDGSENGVIIGWINYPRFPRSRKKIRSIALQLAEKLMMEFNQYKVTVTTPFKSYMLENDNIKR